MYRSEVEEWLYQIGLPELSNYFLEDGFTTIDQVRRMRQSDIDAIVDRNGYMLILNEEIDKLNYSGAGSADYHATRAASVYDRAGSHDRSPEYEPRSTIQARYEAGGMPAVGFASRHLARRAKSKVHKNRAASMAANTRSSVERYVPNSASSAYEQLFAAKRATSVAAINAREIEHEAAAEALALRQKARENSRASRARSGKYNFELIYITKNKSKQRKKFYFEMK
jgi:hypothetical protein